MIVFAHDHKLRFDGAHYYTQGGLADNITQRYSDIYGDLTIICRAIPKKDDEKKLSVINNSNVTISAIHSGSLIISVKDRNRVKNIVKNADGVIVRLPSIIGEWVFKYAKEFNKPILSEVVTCPWDSLWNHSLKGKIMAPIMWWKTKNSVKNSDYVLYVTKEFLQRRYPTDGINIGCSDVELKTSEADVLVQRLKKIQIKASNEPFVLGTLASLNTRFKGQQYVIQAISKLRNEGKIFKYRLAGGGDDSFLREECKKHQVEDLIIWDGLVPHDQVFDWFSRLDLYIQPSEQEGLPRALVEAMSRACPCKGSDVGGIPELLHREDIFKRSSSDVIYSCLKRVNKDTLMESAKNNYSKAKEYTKDRLEPIRVAFYQEFREKIITNK